MSTDHDDRANRDVSRAAQNAAIALLRNISIWRSLSILAEHVSESVPIGRDSIDLCRLLIEDKSATMEEESIQSQQAQNAIHQLLPRLMRQVRWFRIKIGSLGVHLRISNIIYFSGSQSMQHYEKQLCIVW